MEAPPDFGRFVLDQAKSERLVVQPRMGFADPCHMRAGLVATGSARAVTVGTITLDAHTRVGRFDLADQALRSGIPLNGYPLVTHPLETTRWVTSVQNAEFPVQVRHGAAMPHEIFRILCTVPLTATEGGPVSYCLPYGRTPLSRSIESWSSCCRAFAGLRDRGVEPHLETFGGCMLGQLCPPSQLVALSVLEALFFVQHGIRSISVSYAQQTSPEQDLDAVAALRRLCRRLLPRVEWHTVVYAYMGVYPKTTVGAARLLAEAVKLAVLSGAERLLVKTQVEAQRIPTIDENVAALEEAADFALTMTKSTKPVIDSDSQTYVEAATLVESVLELDNDIGVALRKAFSRGKLDIPFCVHPDNKGATMSCIDEDGRLGWESIGALPFGGSVGRGMERPAPRVVYWTH